MNQLLVPFSGKSILGHLRFEARVTRNEDETFGETGVTVTLSLDAPADQLAQIIWPQHANHQANRRDELWKTTCLEAFIGPASGETYFEYNLNPAGDWNIYAFDSYRAGMTSALPEIEKSPQRDLVTTDVHRRVEFLIQTDLLNLSGPLMLSVTAVLEFQNGQKEYWALAHKGEKPDFHLRPSFVIQI